MLGEQLPRVYTHLYMLYVHCYYVCVSSSGCVCVRYNSATDNFCGSDTIFLYNLYFYNMLFTFPGFINIGG